MRPSPGVRSQNLRPGTREGHNGDLTPEEGRNADLTPGVERVEIMHGDLALPRAGLSDRDWGALVARTDAVCHVGASINWVAGYDALRDVNVLATHEMLKLAAEAGQGGKVGGKVPGR